MTDKNNGGTTFYYDVPKGATTLNDLIEHKDMKFWQGEVFKAVYALEERAARATDGTSSEIRELNKIVYYCNRRLKALGVNVVKPKITLKPIKPLPWDDEEMETDISSDGTGYYIPKVKNFS